MNFNAVRLLAVGADGDPLHGGRACTFPRRTWAHVSGWAQLSRTPRHLSFVVIHRNSRALGSLLPVVSDVLTEIGYPWEIAVIDNASTSYSSDSLATWSTVPGFNWIRLVRDYGDMGAIAAGLREARGDAVILANASAPLSIEQLPDVVDRWDGGSKVVSVEWSSKRDNHVVAWRDDVADHLLMGTRDLVLLDRAVVERLLR